MPTTASKNMRSEHQTKSSGNTQFEKRILIIGAGGQIGSELVDYLRSVHGSENVIGSDLRELSMKGPTEQLDVMNYESLRAIVEKYEVTEIYLLAALLSATAEKQPELAWNLNMEGLFNVLNLAKEGTIKKIFWPSSIAVFGPTTPKNNTPQNTVMDPNTVYGVSKLAGERWCEYYHNKYGVDVRSIRYPGLISWKSKPGGGTTDYAVDIFYEALKHGKYTCYLDENRALPMMFMDDAIQATVQLMDAPAENLSVWSSYNLGGVSFTPKQIANSIREKMARFEINYEVDFRDEIAKSWPSSINDEVAQNDWNWNREFDLERIVAVMLESLSKKLETAI
ncbi:MAG: nucleoside-diphosphate-sugar epimerase [Parvicellaceae bacterium]